MRITDKQYSLPVRINSYRDYGNIMPQVPLVPMIFVGLFFVIFTTTIISSVYWKTISGDNNTNISLNPLFIFILPLKIVYYYSKNQLVRQQQSQGGNKRIAGILVIAGVFAPVVGNTLSSPDIISISVNTLLAYPVGVLIGYLLTRPVENWGG